MCRNYIMGSWRAFHFGVLMEAYILHIQYTYLRFESKTSNNGIMQTTKLDTPELITYNIYSAWSTEKQAQKEAARVLLDSSEKYYLTSSMFFNSYETLHGLRKALIVLIKNEHIKEALDLVSEYDFSNIASKMTIKFTITKSTFKGSAFE